MLVTFSSSGDSSADQCTRDLLHCEHLALQVMAQAGLPAAPTQVFERAGRGLWNI